MANDISLGSGVAEQARVTIKQRRCVQDRMALDGMSEAEANKACGVNIKKPTAEMQERIGKKKGGVVKKKSTSKKGSSIHSASKNHKFSY